MRFIFVTIIILCFYACHESREGTFASLDLGSNAVQRVEPYIFHHVETTWIKTDTLQPVEYLLRDTSYYLVIGIDTFTDPLWTSESVENGNAFDTSVIISTPIQLFDDQRLNEIINSANGDMPSYCLINYSDGKRRNIGMCAIHKVNIDEDSHPECVVDVEMQMRHRYHIFDDSLSGWKYHGQYECIDRTAFSEIDDHLKGYIGFQSQIWGTGLSCFNYEYLQLTKDSIRHCFTINSFLGIWLFTHPNGSQIESYSESQMIGDRVQVNHYTTYQLFDGLDPEKLKFTCSDTTRYYLKESRDGKFAPEPRPIGFDVAETNNSIFIPECAILRKVYHLKENGTQRQKFLLRELEVDSSLYYYR